MDPARLPHAPHPLTPDSQTACYSPWLKLRVLIRAALTLPWSPEDWPEIRSEAAHPTRAAIPANTSDAGFMIVAPG
jgi:hypothetical protein